MMLLASRALQRAFGCLVVPVAVNARMVNCECTYKDRLSALVEQQSSSRKSEALRFCVVASPYLCRADSGL